MVRRRRWEIWGAVLAIAIAGCKTVPTGSSSKTVVQVASPQTRDRDGDGILDSYDKCPDEPEDKDGFADDDGCPEPDNDHDGIADARDKCPNEPEDKNGYEDDDGCPDQAGLDKQRKLDEDQQRKAADQQRTADEDKRKADEDKRNAQAAAHFKQGKAFHDAGAYDEAITEYEAANTLAPAPGLLFNLAQVYRVRANKGDAGRALDYYKQYVTAEPNGKAADEARQWIARLTLQLKKK